MKTYNNKIILIKRFNNIIESFKNCQKSIIDKVDLIILQYLSKTIFKIEYLWNMWKYQADIYIDENLSDKIDNYELDQRINISKKELLEIRKILIETRKYEIFDFLETFIDLRKKNDKNLYFEDIVPELYDDLKEYIYDKYFKVEYWAEALIIRDIDVDINNYILPLLWKELSLKLFNDDLIFENKNIKNHIFEFINNCWFKNNN